MVKQNSQPAQQLPALPLNLQHPVLKADYEIGRARGGVSQARFFVCENGDEYILKGKHFSPTMPHVAANEFIAAEIGGHLGLPILDHRTVSWRGDLYFGSRMIGATNFLRSTDLKLVQGCLNAERIYNMLVFDVWLCNTDRHEGNIVVRVTKDQSGNDEYRLIFSDHSHCILAPTNDPQHPLTTISDLASLATSGLSSSVCPNMPYIRAKLVTDMVVDVALLRTAIDGVAKMPDHVVRGVLSRVPPDFLPESERRAIENFLLQRRKRLKQVFRDNIQMLAKLSGGPL